MPVHDAGMTDFLRKNFRWIAGGFLLTYFSSFGQTYFISGSVAEWQTQFGLSHGEFGRLYMYATLASAMCLPLIGRAVDFYPQHRTVAVVIPVLAGAALLAGFAPTVGVLFVAIFLLRLMGQGMMTHIALTATGRWFVARRGRAVSLVVLGHQGGEATLPLAFSALAGIAGYQWGWVAGALVLIAVGLPLATWAYRVPRTPRNPDGTAEVETREGRSWTRREVLGDPIFYLLLVGVLAPPFIGTTIFYHQDYMTALRGWPPHLFSATLTLTAITTVTFALITGALIDRYSARAVLPFFLLPLAVSCYTFGHGDTTLMLVVAMVVLGVSYGFSSTLFGALWPETYGVVHLGSIRSVIVSAMVLSTAIGPGVTGTLIDRGIPLPAQMTAMSLYCLVACGAMAFVSVRLDQRSRSEIASGRNTVSEAET